MVSNQNSKFIAPSFGWMAYDWTKDGYVVGDGLGCSLTDSWCHLATVIMLPATIILAKRHCNIYHPSYEDNYIVNILLTEIMTLFTFHNHN